jgi:heme/copper-type cytochrome/quinol oxidase subunit 4
MNKLATKINLRPCTLVWIILLVLTVAVWMAAQAGLSGFGVVGLILASTLLKTQIVADYFMGLKNSNLLWRMIITLYLIIIISMIALAYWLGIS